MWKAALLLLLALIYVVVPWDLDFVPLFGRVDDLLLLLLALAYTWKRYLFLRGKVSPEQGGRGGEGSAAGNTSSGRDPDEGDPYRVLGVKPGDDEETIRKAYRSLLGKYHPDRVQHLGEEFGEIALRRTKAINLAWQRIRKERKFT